MIYRILRYVIAILVGTAAYVGMDSLAPIIDPYLVSQFGIFWGHVINNCTYCSINRRYSIRPCYWLSDFIIYSETRFSNC